MLLGHRAGATTDFDCRASGFVGERRRLLTVWLVIAEWREKERPETSTHRERDGHKGNMGVEEKIKKVS